MVAKKPKKQKMTTKPYPQWAWWLPGECVVELIKRGHFPTTLIVRLPDNREIEIDEDSLEQQSSIKWISPT